MNTWRTHVGFPCPIGLIRRPPDYLPSPAASSAKPAAWLKSSPTISAQLSTDNDIIVPSLWGQEFHWPHLFRGVSDVWVRLRVGAGHLCRCQALPRVPSMQLSENVWVDMPGIVFDDL